MVGVKASTSMDVQGRSTHSNPDLLADNGSSSGATGLQLKEQSSCNNGFAPKVRKPNTITKQRERWTDEEHNKFIEALKLYGRAWPRIEEHVGTKTAVQIRSHAQKFFSKVVRETSGGNSNSVEPIEIPPPRPKRKPTHPYPRKLGHTLVKETSIPEQPMRPASPSSSVSEQENQSPTSVLSATGSPHSSTQNDSGSPVSATGEHTVVLTFPEYTPPPEETRCSTPVPLTTGFDPEEYAQLNLELFPKDRVFNKEASAEEASTQCLKLFGRTVLVTESHRPSSSPMTTCKSLPLEINKEKHAQTSLGNFIATATESSPEKIDCSWRHSPQPQKSHCYMQYQSWNSDQAAALPWWGFYGGAPYPILPFLNESTGEYQYPNPSEGRDKEGSRSSSSNGSANGENSHLSLDKWREQRGSCSQLASSETTALLKLEESSEKYVKGCVPYKRCMSERDAQSSMITSEDREGQRARLCL